MSCQSSRPRPTGVAPGLVSSILRRVAIALVGAMSIPTMSTPAMAGDATCHVGAYRLAGGEVVDIAPSTEGTLRWRRLDGTTGQLTASGDAWTGTAGWTGRPDGLVVRFGDCASGALRFGDEAAERIALRTIDTVFVSHGQRLAGRLVLPPGDRPVPIVVLLHGAERDAAREFNALQRLLPAAGVGAFVYDKRGTGKSEGTYSQDFARLADDAVAALGEARRLAGPRTARIGFQGPSQGGWVAPIAATRSSVDFIVVSFGLAVSVLDEDREAIVFQMRQKGHGPAAIERALEIGAAAATLFESGFTKGFDRFETLRARYRDEPWYKDVYGNFTHVLLGMTADELRRAGASFRWGTPFRYDPMPTLARLATPQLWVLGGQDIDAPIGETTRRLGRLIGRGRPITLAVYPNAEHGLTEFELAPDGSRRSTRYAPGYFRMLLDFARHGRLCDAYPAAQVTRPRRATAACPTRLP